MKALLLMFYCAAALVDLTALVTLVRTLPSRLRALAAPLPPKPLLPMRYNESLTVVQQVLAARSPAMIDASVRRGLNELIAVLQAEVDTRELADRRIELLSDTPHDRRDLLLTVVLVALGAVLGMAGNIVGALH